MRLTNRARRVVLTIGIILGLILLVLVSLSLLVRIPSIQARIRPRIESELLAALDREVEIGEVHLDLLPLSFDIRNIRIASRKRIEEGVLAEIDGVEVYPSLLDLLRARLRLRRIVVRHPVVTLDLPPAEGKPAPPAPGPAMPVTLPAGIEHVAIRDGSVVWQGAGVQVAVTGFDADVRAPGGALEGTLNIRHSQIRAGATPFLIEDLVLKAEVDGDDIHVTQLHLTALEADVEVQGKVVGFLAEPTFDLSVRMRGELDDLFAHEPPFPLEADFLLEGKVTGPVTDPSFTGDAALGSGQIEGIAMSGMTALVQANQRELRVKQLTLKTATGDLTGDIALTWKKLRYRLALRGERIHLGELLQVFMGEAPVGGKVTVRVQATGEGADLTKAKGKANLRVKEFHLSDHPKDRGHVQLALEVRNGRVHVKQAKVELASTRLRTKGVVTLGGDVDLNVDIRFSKLEDFGRLLGTDPGELDGQATVKGRLKGPLTDPVLRGTLNWTKGTLLEVTFDSVRAPVEIAFARQTLNSPSFIVRRQKLRGDLKVGLTLAPKPPDRKLLLKHDLTLDIDGKITSPLQQFIGIFADGAEEFTGMMDLKMKVQGTPEKLRGQGKLAVTDALILKERWERMRASVLLDLQQKRVSLEQLEVQRGREKIAGRVELDFKGFQKFELTSTPLAIERLAVLQHSGLTGTIKARSVKGEGPLGKPRVTAKLEVGDLAYRGVGFGRGEGTLTWEAAQERLTGLLSLPERGYTLRADLTTAAPNPYELTLTLDKGDLGTLLRVVWDRLPDQVSGVASGQINVGGRLGKGTPERATVDLETAQLDIQGRSFKTEGRTHLSFDGKQLTISPLSLDVEGGKLNVGGTLGEKMDLTIQGTAPMVLATILSPEIQDGKGLLDLNVAIQGTQRTPKYHGHVRAKDASLRLRVHPEPVEDLTGEVRFTETTVETTDLQARWGGGTVGVTAQGKLEKQVWGWRLQFNLDEGRAKRVLITNEQPENPRVSGNLRVNGELTTAGGAEWLASLGGQVRIKMVRGRIHRTIALERILALLNIRGLFRRGPKGRGMRYDSISATVDFEHGIADTKNFKLRSPALRAGGIVRLNLPARTIDALVAVQPLQLVDAAVRAVSRLPVIRQVGIGTVLFGGRKSVLVVTYRIEGPLDHPTITNVPTRSHDKSVLEILEDDLDLPDGYLSGSDQEPAGENPTPSSKPSS